MGIYQPDIFRTSPEALAKANRASAAAALQDFHFTVDERQARHDYYIREAERHEQHLANQAAGLVP